ncbi:hypothetical protein SAMN04488514_10495 [Kriegella aquimaris]|uniref:Uncharacterized protein n=1 Tax=Kriegella aquimaris TaxID=192904 RepID=A0A1G9PRB3_9FLAO|nr:hypothetical protein SAMN04488514_10495 [Kriegella aquimaris]
MLKWDLKNHKIYVFSEDAPSYLVEFNNERVEKLEPLKNRLFHLWNEKIEDHWKAVTVYITHNCKPGK